MKHLNERGALGGLLIPFVIVLLLFIGSLSFGIWAFRSRQDYKNNVDPKIATAVAITKKQAEDAKEKEFVEREKQPLKEYKGPSQYGSVSIQYPKTWSAYVNENGDSAAVLDGYLHPNFVPGLQSTTAFALRVQVVQSAYDQELRQFDARTKAGTVKVNPFTATKVSSIVGTRIDGEILPKKQGSLVLLPLRDKTLKIWTEANEFNNDFTNIILPNLSFSP